MHFRYPDKPVEATPAVLDTLTPGEWLAQTKPDGWRCLIDCAVENKGPRDVMRLEFLTRHAKPMPIDEDLAHRVSVWLHNTGLPRLLIDAEWMGRRDGQPESLWVFDLLTQGDPWELGGKPAWMRFDMLRTLCRDFPPPDRVRLVEWTSGEGDTISYADFFERVRYQPGIEGIVLKRASSRYIGSIRHCAENPDWLKVKWRAGESGQTRIA